MRISSTFCIVNGHHSIRLDYFSMTSRSSPFDSLPDDKDPLIDEMQERMGELLKYPQELCAARHEIDVLKHAMASEQRDHQDQAGKLEAALKTLHTENATLRQDLSVSEKRLSEVLREKEGLKSTIESLKAELKQAQETSVHQVEQQMTAQTKDFKRLTESKDRKIFDLSGRIEELKTTEAKNMDVIVRQANDCEQLNRENAELVAKVDQLTRENTVALHDIDLFRRQLEDYEGLLAAEKQKRKKSEAALVSMTNEKTQLERIRTDKEAEIEGLVAKLGVIDELNAQLTEEQEAHTITQVKGDKTKRRYKRLLQEIQARDQQLEEAVKELGEVQTNVESLQQSKANLEQQREALQARIVKFERKIQIGSAISTAHKELAHELSRIRETAVGQQPIRFRSILLAAVMVSRWRELVGQPKEFGDIKRAWWWTATTDDDVIIPKIQSLAQTVEDLKATIELERHRAEAAERTHREACDQIEVYEQKVQKCETEMTELQQKIAEVQDMVPREEYAVLAEKHSQTRHSLKEAKRTIQEERNKVDDLAQQVLQFEAQTRTQHARLDLAGKTSRVREEKLLKAQDELNLLKLELQAKTREQLSLERGFVKERAEKKTIAGQLVTHMIEDESRRPRSSPPDYQHLTHTDIGIKLAQMSKALTRH
jgi:chromosome segregation ATPase